MKTSKAGLAALTIREGKRHKAYQDTKGIWTIGVGHTGPEVVPGLVWNDMQIEQALAEDVKEAEDCINMNVTVPLSQNQFDALVSFIFNIGTGGFRKSTCLKLLNLSLYDLAAEAMLMWNKPPEIQKRRFTEYTQFKTK